MKAFATELFEEAIRRLDGPMVEWVGVEYQRSEDRVRILVRTADGGRVGHQVDADRRMEATIRPDVLIDGVLAALERQIEEGRTGALL